MIELLTFRAAGLLLIGASLASLAAPGDTVIIAPGRQQETLKPSGGGTKEKPVVIRFQPGVHTIRIQGTLRIPMFISNAMDSTDPQPVVIHNSRSKNFVFRDCDFYALTGIGFVSQFMENITFQRVNVAPPKGTMHGQRSKTSPNFPAQIDLFLL